MLTKGLRAKAIAARLELSPKTVDTYRASVMRKLRAHNLADLAKLSARREMTLEGER